MTYYGTVHPVNPDHDWEVHVLSAGQNLDLTMPPDHVFAINLRRGASLLILWDDGSKKCLMAKHDTIQFQPVSREVNYRLVNDTSKTVRIQFVRAPHKRQDFLLMPIATPGGDTPAN